MRKLSVLHLIQSYLPTTENWCYHLIKSTPEIEVTIGAKNYQKNHFYNPSFTYIDHPFGAIDNYYRQLDKREWKSFWKKLILKLSLPFIGSFYLTLDNFLRKGKIDIVHIHFADFACELVKLPLKHKLPIIVSFYGWDYEQLPFLYPEYEALYQELFKCVSLFICEGEHGARILESKGCPKNKIEVVPLGVVVDSIPFFKRKKKKESLKLIQIASYKEKKGHIYSVKAVAEALKECPELHLTLVGGERDVNAKKNVLDFIRLNNLEEKITLIDQIDFKSLHDFLEAFDVFIHPSCYSEDRDCEGGAPIVILDAQATGMPIIATNHCDIPEEVIHNTTGLLVPEKDIKQLAASIHRFYLMEDQEYQIFSRNARAHVAQFYDIAKNGKKLKALYDKLF